jgi:hypothetical protein
LPLITKSSLQEHKDVLAEHLGTIAIDNLSIDKSVTFFYRRNNLALADDQDVVILSNLPEEKALQIMAILDKSDEQMVEHLKRREEQKLSDQKVITET